MYKHEYILDFMKLGTSRLISESLRLTCHRNLSKLFPTRMHIREQCKLTIFFLVISHPCYYTLNSNKYDFKQGHVICL